MEIFQVLIFMTSEGWSSALYFYWKNVQCFTLKKLETKKNCKEIPSTIWIQAQKKQNKKTSQIRISQY